MSFIENHNISLSIEFKEILIELVLDLLESKPYNIYQFCLEHFQNIKKSEKIDTFKKLEDFNDKFLQASRTLSFGSNSSHRKYLERRSGILSRKFTIKSDEDNSSIDLSFIENKTIDEINILKQILMKQSVFKILDDNTIDELIKSMNRIDVSENDIIYQIYDNSQFFCVIQQGYFESYEEDEDGELKIIKSYNNQGSFGLMNLIYGLSRSESVIAKSAGILWKLNRHKYKAIVSKRSNERRLKLENYLTNIDMFKVLTKDEICKLVDSMNIVKYDADKVICKENDIKSCLYLIEEGKVNFIDKSSKGKDNKILNEGDYFCEIGLISNLPLNFECITLEVTSVFILNRDCFERLLGPCLELLKRDKEIYDDTLKKILDENV